MITHAYISYFSSFCQKHKKKFLPTDAKCKMNRKGRFTNLAVIPCFEWAIQLHNALRRKPAPAEPKVNKKPKTQTLPFSQALVYSVEGGCIHSVCCNTCESVGKQLLGVGSRGIDARDIFICTMDANFSSSMLESFNLCSRLGQMKNSFHFTHETRKLILCSTLHWFFGPSVIFYYLDSQNVFTPSTHLLFFLYCCSSSHSVWSSSKKGPVALSLPPQEVIPAHSTPHSNFSWTSQSSQYPFALLLDKIQKLQQ